jgi:hypothetical protein
MKNIFLAIVTILLGVSAYAQEVTVPAGQVLKAVNMTPLHSETSARGQGVSFVLDKDFVYGGHVIAPAGSSVVGTVIDVSKAKRGSINGKLLVRFNMIITRYGSQIPITAVIKTADGTGMLSGGTRISTAEDVSRGVVETAGMGALAGIMVSPLAGGSVGKGTAVATAVGGCGTAIKTAYDKGEEVLIPMRTQVDIVLTQPVKVTPEVNTD